MGSRNMMLQFDLVNDLLNLTLEQMKKYLTSGEYICQDKRKLKTIYPSVEMFAYLLFQIDYLVVNYQIPAVRNPLINHLEDEMLKNTNIPKLEFNRVIDKRMEEYGSIMIKWSAGEITDKVRTERLVQGYLRNLVYSISEQKFLNWEGSDIGCQKWTPNLSYCQ